MKFIKFLLPVLVVAFTIVSCQKDDMLKEEEAALNESPDSNLNQEVSKETLALIASLELNNSDVEVVDFMLPNGETVQKYLVGGDLVMDDDQINYMQKFFTGGDGEEKPGQYHTYNLVSSPSTVNVIGYTGGGGQGLTSKERSALQRAVYNYNQLNIGIQFTLTFGTNYGPYDIVVYQNPNGQAGGVAGFPQNGNAYKFVQIFSGMNNYSINTIEHVMTHEIGHCMGMRHTDWFSRQSCGQSGEAQNPTGAVHIPGTPTGYDANSIMLACFGGSEDGEFGYYDEVALEYLY